MGNLNQFEYRTIAKPGEGLYKDKGSKFLPYCFFCETEDEAKQLLDDIRKAHHTARHYCYAYRINPQNIYERANDDGEPRHSAGTPILGQLQSAEVVNALVVVVRYFGGTKLGVSGLIQAYRQAAKESIENAKFVIKELKKHSNIKFEYVEMSQVMRIVKDFGATIEKQEMEYDVKMTLSIRGDKLKLMHDQLFLLKSLTFIP
jgi:uncharacterized YigZ family protein